MAMREKKRIHRGYEAAEKRRIGDG